MPILADGSCCQVISPSSESRRLGSSVLRSHHQNAPPLALLIALSALGVLPFNLFVPSMPSIATELETDFATINIAVAGYAVVTAFTHLIAGTLSDRLGRRPVLLVALAIFVIGSIGCCFAGNVYFFLGFRLLQGSAVAGFAMSLAMIRDTAGERMVSQIGYVSSAYAIAPMIGPSIGGILAECLGWRANFAALALLGAVGIVLVLRCLPETNRNQTMSTMQQYRGYKQLLASARFWAYACCMAFAIGTLYVFIGGAPIVAAQTTGISTTMVGVYLGLVPAGFMVGSFAAARYGARLTPLQLIVSGRLLTCAGLLIAGALAALQINHPIAFFGPCVCVGLGNGLTMPAANSRVLSVYAGLSGTALGLASAITTAGAGAIAFAAGLFVEATNARAYVLAAMFTTSLMSLAAAAFVVRLDSERSDAP